jgi:hypothetical protein
MQATTTMTASRGQSDSARARAIVRFNGLMFHSLATASFLESAVTLHVEDLSAVLAAQPEERLWLEQVWLPQRLELGRQLREYTEATWPELDWNGAYAEFHQPCRARAGSGRARSGITLEVLAHCVAEAQAAVFYRALAGAADEPSLRVLAREAASAHAAFFGQFRGIFEASKRRERVSFAATWRMLLAACRSAREFHVRTAFEALAQSWHGPRSVPELAYGEFVQRLVQLVRRHAGLGRIEQFLFRPWLCPESPALAALPSSPEQRARPPLMALQPA